MNAKLRLLTAIAAVQMLAPTLFAQSPLRSHTARTQNLIYDITGRVVQVNADTIVIRARNPDRGNFVLFYFPDTKFVSPVRVGDTVTIEYKMAAVTVTPVGTTPRSR